MLKETIKIISIFKTFRSIKKKKCKQALIYVSKTIPTEIVVILVQKKSFLPENVVDEVLSHKLFSNLNCLHVL